MLALPFVDETCANSVIALPLVLIKAVRARAARCEDPVARVLHQAVEAFARLTPNARGLYLKQRRTFPRGAWELLPTYPETRWLARQCQHRTWAVSDIYLTALAWYLLV